MRLPSGFKAFSAQKGMSGAGFELAEGEGARLKGTIDPGQHDVSFRFQVPKSGESDAAFHIGALPRTAELRVVARAGDHAEVEVVGERGEREALSLVRADGKWKIELP